MKKFTKNIILLNHSLPKWLLSTHADWEATWKHSLSLGDSGEGALQSGKGGGTRADPCSSPGAAVTAQQLLQKSQLTGMRLRSPH